MVGNATGQHDRCGQLHRLSGRLVDLASVQAIGNLNSE